MDERPSIVHVTADHPDPIVPRKTTAIADLIALTDTAFDNRILSINRTRPSFKELVSGALGQSELSPKSDRVAMRNGEAWRYRAPGLGLLHWTFLERLGDAIADELAIAGVPDLIVAHKLTIEGVAVARAARLLGRPFAITIQGDTDTKILAARPDLQSAFADIFHAAASVVSLAPWSLSDVERILAKREGPRHVIPAPTDLDEELPVCLDGKGLISVFHLQSLRRKNLAGMVKAMRHLRQSNRDVTLSIVGGGSARDLLRAQSLTKSARNVVLEGRIDRHAIAPRLNRAAAFVLPSRRESFGLVFLEALFAGCPIIYPAGRSIDGYFDDLPFAIPTRWGDTDGLVRAMQHAVNQQSDLKEALDQWRESGGLDRFRRPAIAASYQAALREAMQGKGATNEECHD